MIDKNKIINLLEKYQQAQESMESQTLKNNPLAHIEAGRYRYAKRIIHLIIEEVKVGNADKLSHDFVGRSDRWCEVCNEPDRHHNHGGTNCECQECVKDRFFKINTIDDHLEQMKPENRSDCDYLYRCPKHK